MKTFSSLIILLVFFGSSQSILAQDQWTLEKCIEYALTNNVSLKQQALNVDASKDQLFQSKMSLAPSVNGSLSASDNFGRSVDPTTYQYVTQTIQTGSAGLSGSWTLFSGLRKWNLIKQGQYDLDATEGDFKQAQNSLMLNVTSYYLLILFAYEQLDVAQKQVDLSLEQYNRTDRLVKAGTLAEGALLEIVAQQKRDDVTLTTAKNNLQSSLLNLKQLLNLDAATAFDIVRPELPDPDVALISHLNPTDIYNIATTSQPQIGSAEFRMKSAEKGLAIAHGGHSPTLEFFANLNTNFSNGYKTIDGAPYYIGDFPIGYLSDAQHTPVLAPEYGYNYVSVPFQTQAKDNFSQGIGISLSIPIFNNWQTNTQVSLAKINLLRAQYSLDLSKQQLMKDIQQAYNDALAAGDTYKASQSSVDAVQKSFYYTEQRFNAGLINAFEYNQAKQNLSSAQSDMLRAKYDFIFKMKVLDFYQGNSINFN